LGDYNKSREYYQQVLATAKQLKNRNAEGQALVLLANTSFALGEPQKTVEYAEQALTIFKDIKQPRLEAFTNTMLVLGYGELGNDAKAMSADETFLSFTRKVQNPVWEKAALTLLGNLHRKFGRKEQAITTYQQALAIQGDNQVAGADAAIYAGLARTYRDLNQTAAAITNYKLAIDRIEAVRRGIEGLPPQLQASFLNATADFGKVKTSDTYRELAELLRSQGKEVEALQVTELLKIQELNEFARGEDKKIQIPLSPAELETQKLQGTLIAFGQRVAECEQQKCSQLSQLRTELDNLNREFFQKIKEIEKAYDGKYPNLIYPGNFLNDAKSVVEAQPNTVLVYPLVLEDKISILWASRGVVVKSVEVNNVKQSQLIETVVRFRELLETPTSDITELKATDKQLYDWLIKPIEWELKKNKIENVVFALDRSTRYIPMSALFDGNQYLVENYNVSTVISASLTNKSDSFATALRADRLQPGTQNTPVLALGLSAAVTNFNPLPAVEQELDAIIKSNATDAQGIYPGLKFLNQAFNWEALRDNLTGKKILHIATHGAFVPNDPAASYLLSGTGTKIPITEIQLLQNLNNLHLVVLSACETARGGANQNGVEISGISSYFIGNNRAKAVRASLWLVNDTSTALLMQKFYSNLAQDTPPTKAQALRQAQLNMLKGNTTTNANTQRNIVVEARPNAPNQQRRSGSKFAHPYYWALFILIGNGL